MTQWLYIFLNPVVFFVTAGSFLIITYLVEQAAPEVAFWTLMILATLLFATLFAAISVIKQLRTTDPSQGEDGRLYQVFAREEAVLVQMGVNLKRMTRGVPDLLRLLSGVRQQLAERYGYVVPEMEMEYAPAIGAQTVQVVVRQSVIGQFDLYPDCLAVPVDGNPNTALVDSIDQQPYAWTPQDEVSLHDRAVALTAPEFMALRLQSLFLDHAPDVISRTDALKLIAIVQRQDPVIFNELFEANRLDVSTFRSVVADMLQRRMSIRNILQVCDILLQNVPKRDATAIA